MGTPNRTAAPRMRGATEFPYMVTVVGIAECQEKHHHLTFRCGAMLYPSEIDSLLRNGWMAPGQVVEREGQKLKVVGEPLFGKQRLAPLE